MPAAMLALRGFTGDLGANPVAEALNACGELAIKVLLLCLACTPLRIVFGWTWQMRARKHLGLLAFTYASLHFGIYVGLDKVGALSSILADIVERPFIIVGLTAFLLLVPLAVTSTKSAIKKLGGKRWNRLHQLVYVVAVLAMVHFVMRAKKDTTEAYAHGAVLALLLGVRVVDRVRRRSRARTVTA
ncbi:MAG: sulfoxide reductase heme-binding subunit YedZ [Polyangiaceae bacterium]|nr:sulfoxide reductase heme-binding subunit YedZ [Polyangiaceae bacterium]